MHPANLGLHEGIIDRGGHACCSPTKLHRYNSRNNGKSDGASTTNHNGGPWYLTLGPVAHHRRIRPWSESCGDTPLEVIPESEELIQPKQERKRQRS